jgi:CRP/FNR family transcriptional regulator, cyclic AMP receptor protein
MKHDVKRILGQHFILKYLPLSDLEALSHLAASKTYKAGEYVFLKGDPGTAMMAVLSGRVRICSNSAEGREVVLNVISAGEVFGEIAMIDGGERTADAFAMEPTELLVLNRRDFMPVLARNPDVCIKLLELLCRRLRWTSEQMEDISLLDLRSRLAKRLIYLADHHGEPAEYGDRKTVRISQQLLANMIGASREAVNIQLAAWKEEGVISSRRGWITILDRDRLDQVVEDVA